MAGNLWRRGPFLSTHGAASWALVGLSADGLPRCYACQRAARRRFDRLCPAVVTLPATLHTACTAICSWSGVTDHGRRPAPAGAILVDIQQEYAGVTMEELRTFIERQRSTRGQGWPWQKHTAKAQASTKA